ncbi:hypothetical protein RvY_11763 [Ramazzottius varieornatus]|uniref:Uncharacterized protein n=1 Tax=Ramazzottius varieornatus TaxID=947166 RepID=A0A1D1VPX0_RAMVA|nr:hypothetical protein RvY_11763 [Ramazzottius varieornatus]
MTSTLSFPQSRSYTSLMLLSVLLLSVLSFMVASPLPPGLTKNKHVAISGYDRQVAEGEMAPRRKRQVNSSSIEAPELGSTEAMDKKGAVPEVDTSNEVKDSPGEDVDDDVVDFDAQ